MALNKFADRHHFDSDWDAEDALAGHRIVSGRNQLREDVDDLSPAQEVDADLELRYGAR